MNKKKIGILLLAALAGIAIGIIILYCFSKNNSYDVKSAEEGDISRYEWLKMLCEQNGLTEYQNEDSYYEDVNAVDPYFSYIQSAVEWGVIEPGKDFAGDGYASGRFVALTAMKSIGEGKLQIYLETENAVRDSACIELATEYGLIEKDQLAEGVSEEECRQVLEKLENLYFTEFWRDDYENVTYQDGVIELSASDVLRGSVDGSELVVADQVRETLEEGTVIVYQQKNTKLKLAGEITGIDADGTVSLRSVELDQVVESLTASDITEMTFEDIVNYYELDENTYTADNLKYRRNDIELMNTPVFSADINSKGFELSLSTEDEEDGRYLEVEITDNATEESCTLPIHEKVESGNEYSAEINVDKILIGGQIDYSARSGVKYAEVAVDSHCTFGGEVRAEKEKKIPLWKTPVPLGNGVVGVDIQVNLVLSVDGSISFEVELPLEVSLYYEKDRGLKNRKHEISPESPTIEVNCEAGATLGLGPTLVLLGHNIVGAEADLGIEAAAESTLRSNSQICVDISVSFPIITVSAEVGDDIEKMIQKLDEDFEGSIEWEIMSSENALFKKGLHYEILPDEQEQFVEECTYSETKSKEEDSKPNAEESNTYYTKYKEVMGDDSPVFCFDYSDDWNVSIEEINSTPMDFEIFGDYVEEVVELTNERGVTVTFMRIDGEIFEIAGRGHLYSEYNVEKAADVDFVMKNESASADFVVARLTRVDELIMGVGSVSEGEEDISYAVMQESIVDDAVEEYGSLLSSGPLGYYEMISFNDPAPYVFFADAPDGQFTEEEEKEVIDILSSFREAQ